MKLKLFDYNLPKGLIAQKPLRPRDHSRLFVYDRQNNKIWHKHFYDLPKYLSAGDVLVFNNSKVFPARLIGKKDSGGKIEIFLLQPANRKPDLGIPLSRAYGHKNNWQVLIGGKRRHIGTKVAFGKNLSCEVIKLNDDDTWQVKFNLQGSKFWQEVKKYGLTPTPPYIKRKSNLKDYQTVYAKELGSVAAPTAGFHFTKTSLNNLKKQGVQIEFITLHVGLGTFAPVKSEEIERHKLHPEWAEIDRATAKRLNKAKKEGRRIIAVGTTTIRTLEAFTVPRTSPLDKLGVLFSRGEISKSPLERGLPPNGGTGCVITSGKKWVNVFIYPGYRFRFVDSVITNFHLPQSTLLMLIAAFLSNNKSEGGGIRKIKQLYKTAINKKYRFYSFGDGMFIY